MLTTIRPEVSKRIIELVNEHWGEIQAPGRSNEANGTRNRAWTAITNIIKSENPGLLTDVSKIKKHWHYMKFQARERSRCLKRCADNNERDTEMPSLAATKEVTLEILPENKEHGGFSAVKVPNSPSSTPFSDAISCQNTDGNDYLPKVYLVDASSSCHDEATTPRVPHEMKVPYVVQDTTEAPDKDETRPVLQRTPIIKATSSLTRGPTYKEQKGKKRTVAVGYPASGICSMRNLQAKVLQAQLENEKLRKVVLEKTNKLLDKAESVGLVELIAQTCGAVFFDVETVDNDI